MTAMAASVTRGSAAVAAVAGFVVAAAAVAAVSFLGARDELRKVTHSIAFNHRVHVEDEGLECSTCHPFFETQTNSGMPTAAVCSMCHFEAQGESAAEHELVARLEAGEELVWGRVFRQPPHVFYSHRRHVVVAGLTCDLCHADIGTSEKPPDRAAPMRMDTCLDCHRHQQASTDCTACHR